MSAYGIKRTHDQRDCRHSGRLIAVRTIPNGGAGMAGEPLARLPGEHRPWAARAAPRGEPPTGADAVSLGSAPRTRRNSSAERGSWVVSDLAVFVETRMTFPARRAIPERFAHVTLCCDAEASVQRCQVAVPR